MMSEGQGAWILTAQIKGHAVPWWLSVTDVSESRVLNFWSRPESVTAGRRHRGEHLERGPSGTAEVGDEPKRREARNRKLEGV